MYVIYSSKHMSWGLCTDCSCGHVLVACQQRLPRHPSQWNDVDYYGAVTQQLGALCCWWRKEFMRADQRTCKSRMNAGSAWWDPNSWNTDTTRWVCPIPTEFLSEPVGRRLLLTNLKNWNWAKLPQTRQELGKKTVHSWCQDPRPSMPRASTV